MLLRPSNTLLLDEPTNHLDIDSTNVLLDALNDYSGTLMFVSHDRYFVDRLSTKVLEIGDGDATLYPGTYEEFRLSKLERTQRPTPSPASPKTRTVSRPTTSAASHRRGQTEARRQERQRKALQTRISDLEQRISDRELTVQQLEAEMASPDFYSNAATSQDTISRHQTLMWEVGDLMNQWEALQNQASEQTKA